MTSFLGDKVDRTRVVTKMMAKMTMVKFEDRGCGAEIRKGSALVQ